MKRSTPSDGQGTHPMSDRWDIYIYISIENRHSKGNLFSESQVHAGNNPVAIVKYRTYKKQQQQQQQ